VVENPEKVLNIEDFKQPPFTQYKPPIFDEKSLFACEKSNV